MNRLYVLLAAIAIAADANAEKRAFTIADLYKIKGVYSIAVSPDGTMVSYTLGEQDLPTHSAEYNVCLIDADGTNPRMITSDGKSGSAVWNADGSCLYYSKYVGGNAQLFRYDMSTGESIQLTDYALGVTDPVVAPNERYVAFTADIYPEIGIDAKANIERKDKKEKGPVKAHIADRLLYRHWTEYNDGRRSHLIVYDMEERTYTDLTPGDQSLLFNLAGDVIYTFSPDSKEICYVANKSEHPEANTNADLYIVDVAGGQSRCVTSANKAWDGSPSYSPDGRYIAYRTQEVEGYESDLFRLALFDRSDSTSSIISGDYDNWIDDYQWSDDARYIYCLTEERGYQPIYRIDMEKGGMEKVMGKRAVAEYDISDGTTIYYTYSTTGKPSALYRQSVSDAIKECKGKGGAETQLTFYNQALEDSVDIRPSESVFVEGADGDSVEVFIVKPHNFDPSARYPLVINVHGGPQMQWMDSFRGDWQVYPGAGYVVAYPNPHGSTGYGQDFCRAISLDWGGKVFDDIMKVTDYLASLEYVDSTRMGAMGWSYGGYMMDWLQGHTKRYKCLASMMGVYDLRSMWGSTEELWFPNFDLGGQPWNSDLYEKWSPSSYIANFSTPCLVITGELDYRVPYTQSLQYFTALQTLDIPSRLIVFKYDGHWPATMTSMPVYYNAHLEWFHEYLGGEAAPYDTKEMVDNMVEY